MSNPDPVVHSGRIPVAAPTAILSYGPVRIDLPHRVRPLELTVSAPVTGTGLPVIVFSHGHGASAFLSSRHGYRPLVDFWAAHGFVVVQPTHLDAGMLGLRDADDPDAPLYWRSRTRDVTDILDHLPTVEADVPGLVGRIDRSRIVAAGHSLGGHTTCLLLGMRVRDPVDGAEVDLRDPRVRAGVVMAAPGIGDDLADWAATHYPVLRHADFSRMHAPALVVAGTRDLDPHFSERLGYRSDAYTHSPGPKTLLSVTDGEHMLSGVSGFDVAETTDEDPERVAAVRALAWAYLRSTLYPGDPAWDTAARALRSLTPSLARIESRPRTAS
ncbi:chlorophyllase [Pseudonocardia sp. ICBG1293]|uniref:alpha/beta hydrolase family protein n=1 Tax=Pseudonocardia sp. ICBG1293 TaxID=2844382 RepID=UPI001CCF742E|nr:chlorophyllase [Pseudonocardia sp. ICBG1293]